MDPPEVLENLDVLSGLVGLGPGRVARETLFRQRAPQNLSVPFPTKGRSPI